MGFTAAAVVVVAVARSVVVFRAAVLLLILILIRHLRRLVLWLELVETFVGSTRDVHAELAEQLLGERLRGVGAGEGRG